MIFYGSTTTDSKKEKTNEIITTSVCLPATSGFSARYRRARSQRPRPLPFVERGLLTIPLGWILLVVVVLVLSQVRVVTEGRDTYGQDEERHARMGRLAR